MVVQEIEVQGILFCTALKSYLITQESCEHQETNPC